MGENSDNPLHTTDMLRALDKSHLGHQPGVAPFREDYRALFQVKLF